MKARLVLTALLTVSAGGAAFVSQHEGRKLRAYKDPVGIVTVCDGHTSTARLGQVKTPAECDALLRGDLRAAEEAVRRLVKVPLSQETFDALVSFVFNVGEGNFAKSTLLKKLNRGDYVGACNELPKWSYARGVPLPGLVTRRSEERKACLKGLQ